MLSIALSNCTGEFSRSDGPDVLVMDSNSPGDAASCSNTSMVFSPRTRFTPRGVALLHFLQDPNGYSPLRDAKYRKTPGDEIPLRLYVYSNLQAETTISVPPLPRRVLPSVPLVSGRSSSQGVKLTFTSYALRVRAHLSVVRPPWYPDQHPFM